MCALCEAATITALTFLSQIVNDDIEVIEETIPKLETFNQSYSQLLSMTEDLLAKITACSVSAISSDGLEAKGQGLQVLCEVTPRVPVTTCRLLLRPLQ